MMTPARIVRLLGFAGLMGWLGMVGWVAKTTLAQQQVSDQTIPVAPAPIARPAAPLTRDPGNPPPPITPTQPPPPPTGVPAISGTAPAPTPAVDNTPAPIAPEEPKRKDEPVSDVAGAFPADPPADIATDTAVPSSGSEDPEQAARSFAERSQREAEEHLRVLTAEASRLHGRLTKVESAIKQWQSLADALKSARNTGATAAGAIEEQASELEPTASETGRGDRRRWASASSATPGAAPALTASGVEDAELAPTAVPGTARAPQPVATPPR